MVRAFIGLGANLGEAAATVEWAMQQLAGLTATTRVAQSSLYRSVPVDAPGPDYINAVMAIDTDLTAHELLQSLQHIEQVAGRERPCRNAPRTLDLDLLLYGDACLNTPALQVPHPRMWQRAFVLLPLAEIAPDRISAAQLQVVQVQSAVRLSHPGAPEHGVNQVAEVKK